MKTLHDATCECCPTGPGARMTVWAEMAGDKFSWGTETPCSAGHYPMTINSAELKLAHKEAVDKLK